MARGITQTSIKRAIVLADEALKIKRGKTVFFTNRAIRNLFEFVNLGFAEPPNGNMTAKNVMGSICSEVQRISNGWLVAKPVKGGVEITNGFTYDYVQRRNKKFPD